MRNIFLKAKAWQIVILIFLILLFSYIYFMNRGIKFEINENFDKSILFFPALSIIVITLWYYINGMFIIECTNINKKSKYILFNIIFFALIISIIITLNIVINLQMKFNNMNNLFAYFESYEEIQSKAHLIKLSILLYIFFILNLTYNMHKMDIIRGNKSIIQTILYLLALLFFPFGIWYIQPKINKLYDEYKKSEEEYSK